MICGIGGRYYWREVAVFCYFIKVVSRDIFLCKKCATAQKRLKKTAIIYTNLIPQPGALKSEATEQNRTDLFRRKNIPLVSLYGKSNLIQHKVRGMATGKLRMDPAVIESSNHPVSVIYKKEFCFIYEFHKFVQMRVRPRQT